MGEEITPVATSPRAADKQMKPAEEPHANMEPTHSGRDAETQVQDAVSTRVPTASVATHTGAETLTSGYEEDFTEEDTLHPHEQDYSHSHRCNYRPSGLRHLLLPINREVGQLQEHVRSMIRFPHRIISQGKLTPPRKAPRNTEQQLASYLVVVETVRVRL